MAQVARRQLGRVSLRPIQEVRSDSQCFQSTVALVIYE